MTNWLFFGLCTLVDLAISVLFPGNFLMNDLVFLPSVGFCSLVLVIREEMLFDRCLTAFLYGLLVDLFVTDTFLLHASVYLLIALLLQLWSRHMGDSMLESIIDLAKQIVPLINSLVDRIDKFTSAESRFGDSLQSVIEKVSSALQEWITTNLLPTAQSALEYITSSVAAVLVFLYNFLVGIIVAVYALAEKKNFVAVAKKLTYVLWNPKHANRVVDTARHGHEIFGGFLSGKLIDSLIVGILCFIFCVCTNMPYSLLISTIVGVTNIIPFFGPFIGGIPTTFIVLVVDPPKGVLFGIFIIILQQIDGNIIGAKILGNTTGMSEFWVTFSLLLFGGMFGFVGMMIGVPLFSVIYYLATVLVNEKAEKRGLKTADEFYYAVDRYDTAAGEFVMMDENAAKKRRKPRKDGKEPIVKRIGNRFRRKK